ncbi:tetratricopeptide repeat protein [Ancylostoma duodenale]|nr:tetratricopeptide repeat protein [Ancylostoma duodenale]
MGAYYIDAQFSEKAVNYFEKASIMQPNEIKWQLMMASSHRRAGNYQKALELYRNIHKKFPANIECK